MDVETADGANRRDYLNNNTSDAYESKDEVDFVPVAHNNNNNNVDVQKVKDPKDQKRNTTKERLSLFSFSRRHSQKGVKDAPKEGAPKTPPETPTTLSGPPPPVPIGTPPRQHKFVKSSSLARLLGNTYNAKKFEKEERKRLASEPKYHTYSGRRRTSGPYLERFKSATEEESEAAAGDVVSHGGVTLTTDSRDLYGGSRHELVSWEHFVDARSEDLGAKAFRTISRGLGKLWWRRTHSVEISTPDPEFKVSYLGNVLTGWAKGEGCVEKQLNTLWRNYTQNNKPDVVMRIKVCASGLKATTRQHGLTEYWANRITHCCAPKNYPRVFCWIYRHEGRKLKHELRCHAVLCSKERIVQDICNTLKDNLESALREFKREKILKQNARLSLANAAYDNPSLPRRKILLSVGGNNYRPPLERSKSAPKLTAIEEAIGEEDGDEVEDTNEPEMRPCCQKDSLYPAMTLGRRRCRRGHSIRRTGKAHVAFCEAFPQHGASGCCGGAANAGADECATKEAAQPTAVTEDEREEDREPRNSYGSSDSDDFEKLLKYSDYDPSASLATELLPYFERQLHKTSSCSLGSLTELKDDAEPLSLSPTINSDPSAHPNADYAPTVAAEEEGDGSAMVVELRRRRQVGVCSDGEEDFLDGDAEADDLYFRQASLLTMLHRSSMRKMTELSMSSDESSIETNGPASLPYRHQLQSSISSDASSTATSASATHGGGGGDARPRKQTHSGDSDEGSISSGCETASTVTANQDDVSLQYRQCQQPQASLLGQDGEPGEGEAPTPTMAEPISAEEIYQRLESRLQRRHNSDATTFSSSSSITLKLAPSPSGSIEDLNASGRTRRARRLSAQRSNAGDSDSECSDESGYVEFQEQRDRDGQKTPPPPPPSLQPPAQLPAKPQVPPKPMPRRISATCV